MLDERPRTINPGPDLRILIVNRPAGSKVKLGVTRAGQPVSAVVVLGEVR
jgi:hypothetical protein